MDDSQLKTDEAVVEASITDGDWTGKPAVAATGVAMKNTSGYHAWVEVSGGTVTSVKVDGVTVGSRTSGAFIVKRDSTIAWVGSAAPTMQWFLFE